MNFTRHHAIVTLAIGLFCLASCGDNSSSEGPVASAEDTGTHSSSEEFQLSSSEDSNWGNSSSVEESSSSIEPNSSSELLEPVESSSSSTLVESSSSDESVETSSSELPAVSSSSKSLNGVVWYVVGDSFSAGDFEGLDPKPTIQEGPYAGKPPVYSYLIGNRTGCDVRNISAGGTTICYYDTYGFTKPENGIMYRTNFSDADIITIYYGINDSHNRIPIGNIDDMDPTTFYGAFNVALDYLTKNYPKAKIGIIVSNGCETEDYPEATEQIAIKWELPYLDLDGGVNGITMLRSSSRNPTPDAEKTEILKQQWVHEHNWHPNEYAHELESHFIEEWLLTLL
ncbi:MAG: SGNH/GDSL hydrolase family protein [Fibrobacter sp.]|nr:SGNH/GDSL hydrolase family protein [Fibrobacter sp.]